jgi:hypothetical protein
MNVIINFITKNMEIFLLILLLLSVLILFKYNLKEGHTSDTEECVYDYTNEILEVMTKYLDVNNKIWNKLIEINNFYISFQDEMKVHGMTASHEKTCSNSEAVLPIDIAEKYMKDSEDFLVGDGGMYELYVEHTILFDELIEYKSRGDYNENVIVLGNTYDPDRSITDNNGEIYYERAAWGGIENGVTFSSEEKIGDPEENGNNQNYKKTYAYQVCSVSEYIIGEIWKHCGDSICQQMTSSCDNKINNLTNKWTFDKTKICKKGKAKCPGVENAFMTYIGYPKPGLSTNIYVDPGLAAPTKDCPNVTTKTGLRDCYFGKKESHEGWNSNYSLNNDIHYWKEKNIYDNSSKRIGELKAQIENQTLTNETQSKDAADALARELAALSAPILTDDAGKGEEIDCIEYTTQLDSSYSRSEAEAEAVTLCKQVGCVFETKKPNGNNAVQKKNNGKWKIECQ